MGEALSDNKLTSPTSHLPGPFMFIAVVTAMGVGGGGLQVGFLRDIKCLSKTLTVKYKLKSCKPQTDQNVCDFHLQISYSVCTGIIRSVTKAHSRDGIGIKCIVSERPDSLPRSVSQLHKPKVAAQNKIQQSRFTSKRTLEL